MEALAIWREGRGESVQARYAMLCVIRNRAADPQKRWPRNVIAVITQPLQFSSFNSNDPNSKVWPPADGSPGQWQAWCDNCDIVTQPLQADPTGGANCYEAMPEGAALPKWADPAKMTVQLGRTRFYKL